MLLLGKTYINHCVGRLLILFRNAELVGLIELVAILLSVLCLVRRNVLPISARNLSMGFVCGIYLLFMGFVYEPRLFYIIENLLMLIGSSSFRPTIQVSNQCWQWKPFRVVGIGGFIGMHVLDSFATRNCRRVEEVFDCVDIYLGLLLNLSVAN